ncbi:nucleotide sugar dehydrogenase [Haladaptatus sp. F3-133]|uniref:UDP-N-acetyl-D-mannosamine dehydrogenase n=1 Tax=Halorutilus salinus TaxID=2487751 RepID=A0A9Q4C5E2_9EURY|nr:nucleotide sugar dehydrogenase [Halorutilus salinus]MCX2818611.1 nucleotide sugar dehydrogenase [Halorutilus salinus]
MTEMGVVGLGYVGLPLALAMEGTGHDVVGVDVDASKIEDLRNGESYVNDVTDDEVTEASGFRATTDYSALAEASLVSVCVPTPLRKTGTPDVSYVVDATEELVEVLSEDTTVVLESTVYPGCTEEVIVPILEDNGFTVGEDVHVASSPERIDPGNKEYDPIDIPKVLGGVTDACGDAAESVYATVFDEVVRVDSSTEAELVKLLENTFRAVNIGMINELATVANEFDADIWNVVDAAATKPFGFMPFYPGPGLGGHCIPIDPLYLSWKANEKGAETRFVTLADRVNRSMPAHVVERVTDILNEAHVAVPDAEVLVLGVAYKPDVSDTRESPAYDVIEKLREKGASLTYHDPYVPTFGVGDKTYESRELTSDLIASHDCTVILTDHSEVEYGEVVENAPFVFDTRNATEGYRGNNVRRL